MSLAAHRFAHRDVPTRSFLLFPSTRRQSCTGSLPVQGLKKQLLERITKNEYTRNLYWFVTFVVCINSLIAHRNTGLCPYRRSARLFGAAETLIPSICLEMSKTERAKHDQAIAATRAALGEEGFTTAWVEGRALTMEQAIAYALEDSSD